MNLLVFGASGNCGAHFVRLAAAAGHRVTAIVRAATTYLAPGSVRVIRGDVLVAFGPEHAHTIASGGMSRGDVQKFLYERARNKVALLKLRAMYKAGNWPDWVDVDDDEALCPIVAGPEDIHIVVTGGPGKHSAFIPSFGGTTVASVRIAP